jgi:hypothetical protein
MDLDEPMTHFDDPPSLESDVDSPLMASSSRAENIDNRDAISDEIDPEPPFFQEGEDFVKDNGNDGEGENGAGENSDNDEGEDSVGDGNDDEGKNGVGDEGDDDEGESVDDEYDVNMSTNIDNEIEFDIQQTRSSCDRLAQSQEMINAIRDAQFKDDMDDTMLSRMLNLPRSQPDITYSKQIFIRVFDELRNGSQQMYNGIKKIMADLRPPILLNSHHLVKKSVKEITGIENIETDMCQNSCVAYTGPFSTLEECPYCAEPRYVEPSTSRKRTARRRFSTIPLGPQLQAMYRSPESADRMNYRARKTKEIIDMIQKNGGKIDVTVYEDIVHGLDYIEAVLRGDIKEDDVVCTLAIDGAQLYRDKESECWFFVWVILNLSPDLRYKKKIVLPAGFVPGPTKPKNLESFLLPTLRHFSALQKHGLPVWDARRGQDINVCPFWLFGTADTPAMPILSGLVGHGGRLGCCTFCGVPGRLKGKKYYPAALKPDRYNVVGSSHDDVDVINLPSPSVSKYNMALVELLQATDSSYERIRKATGVVRPSICLGLQPNGMLPVPRCFPLDLMHLSCLNIPQHLLHIWRNTINPKIPSDCDFTPLSSELVWNEHGALVASATPYLPSSFNRTPRNPALKLTSGYKAWEFMIYIWVLGPAVFRLVLPDDLWSHFCKLVCGIRIINQRQISSEQLAHAHKMIVEWEMEFELNYYQRKAELLHLIRPSTHAILHAARETHRCGPLNLVAQWALENTVGNLGREIHQHSNPFSNLSQRGLLRAQMNALYSIIPSLNPAKKVSEKDEALGDQYILLHAREYVKQLPQVEEAAVRRYLTKCNHHLAAGTSFTLRKWARVQLPNGQVARSAWQEKEEEKKKHYRNSRNIKVRPILSRRFFANRVVV